MPQLKLPKPNVIIMDLIGTAVKMGFIEKVLEPFVKSDVKGYLDEKWKDKKTQKDIEKLRKEAEKDTAGLKIAAAPASEQEQKDSVIAFVTAAADAKKQTKAFRLFKARLWAYAYEKRKLKTPIDSDVAIQLKKWKDMDIKINAVSNRLVETQTTILSKTNHGDLNLILDGCYDSSQLNLSNAETFVNFLLTLEAKPDTTLFMTKSGEGARGAQGASVKVLLVLTHRKNIDKLTDEEKAMPRIRSFNELEFGTKEAIEAAAAAAAPPAGAPPEGGAPQG